MFSLMMTFEDSAVSIIPLHVEAFSKLTGIHECADSDMIS